MTLASYIGGAYPESFVEPLAVGQPLAEMPQFLTPDVYVPAPLERCYASAWQALPAYWKGVVSGGEK